MICRPNIIGNTFLNFKNSFISKSWLINKHHHTVFLVSYNIDSFDIELFDSMSIQIPEQIQSSVLQRQANFLAGRWCAQHALRELRHQNFTINNNTHRAPIWPTGVIGSISHTSNYAAAVASANSDLLGIGIDIERIANVSMSHALQNTIISPNELNLINSLSNESCKSFLLTLIFSAKESFFKAAYPKVQRYFNFDAIEINHIDILNQYLDCTTTCRLSPEFDINLHYKIEYQMLDDQHLFTSLFI